MAEQALQKSGQSEAELVGRARLKDPVAIRAIIQQNNQRLYRIARSIVRDDSEAEEVLQEAYVRAFSNLDGFRGQAQLATWLARIVMNEALGRLRARRKTARLTAMAATPELTAQVIPFPNATVDPETSMAQREIGTLLEHAIDNLPIAFRTVLV